MRAPRRKRPLRRVISATGLDLAALSRKASYIGSPEHKDSASFAGQPRPRADASICDLSVTKDLRRIKRWLREAFSKGAVSAYREGRFPRYVWYLYGDTVYEARLVNRESGEYKGYPLSADEWPKGIKDVYRRSAV